MNKYLEKIIKPAEQGEAKFQYQLGMHHLAITENYNEAVRWLKLAADQGYVSALIDLGRIYLCDKYGVKDLDKAEQYFQQASKLGGTGAMKTIGIVYYGAKAYKEAIKWFKAANAYSRLGDCYFWGHGVDQNYEEAFKCYLADGNKDMLGECYLHGFGVERNVEKTIELWQSASEERCRYYEIMLKLAHLYGDGIEMPPDYEKAYYWWCELAHNDGGEFGQEGAWPEAMHQLACYNYEGKGVKKSIKRALKFFKYTIDLFYNMECLFWTEYNRDKHAIETITPKIKGDITISDEPDFIVHARKVLVKHGHKSIINKTKKAAQNGDEKAAEILNEFGIEYIIPKLPEAETIEAPQEPIVIEEPKREPPIPISVGDVLIHKTWGDGVVCEADGEYISVEFVSVGKKRFLNQNAFNDGFLTDASSHMSDG